MIGQARFTVLTGALFLDPAVMAEEAKKPHMNIVGWVGIGLAGAAVFMWFKRHR